MFWMILLAPILVPLGMAKMFVQLFICWPALLAGEALGVQYAKDWMQKEFEGE